MASRETLCRILHAWWNFQILAFFAIGTYGVYTGFKLISSSISFWTNTQVVCAVFACRSHPAPVTAVCWIQIVDLLSWEMRSSLNTRIALTLEIFFNVSPLFFLDRASWSRNG